MTKAFALKYIVTTKLFQNHQNCILHGILGLERRFGSFITFGGLMTFEEGFKHPNLRSHGYCCIPKPQSHLHFGS